MSLTVARKGSVRIRPIQMCVCTMGSHMATMIAEERDTVGDISQARNFPSHACTVCHNAREPSRNSSIGHLSNQVGRHRTPSLRVLAQPIGSSSPASPTEDADDHRTASFCSTVPSLPAEEDGHGESCGHIEIARQEGKEAAVSLLSSVRAALQLFERLRHPRRRARGPTPSI